jgi:hypothetical protein
MSKQGNRGRVGRNDWHQRAAEYNDLAAHAHRVAATHHDKGDHQTGHELTRHAMEYSAKAYQYSQEAHKISGISFGQAESMRPETIKPTSSASERSKKKK